MKTKGMLLFCSFMICIWTSAPPSVWNYLKGKKKICQEIINKIFKDKIELGKSSRMYRMLLWQQKSSKNSRISHGTGNMKYLWNLEFSDNPLKYFTCCLKLYNLTQDWRKSKLHLIIFKLVFQEAELWAVAAQLIFNCYSESFNRLLCDEVH